MSGFLAGLGVPDAQQEDEADNTEGQQEPGPHAPIPGGDVAEGERLNRGSQIYETVDDPNRGSGSFAAAEIHGGGSGEQTVGADDAEGHQEYQKAQQPTVTQREGHHNNTDRQQAVQETGGRGAPGLEQFVAHDARQIAADNAGDHQDQTPIVQGEIPTGGSGRSGCHLLLGVDGEPMHDTVSQHTGAKLDARHSQDNGIGEDSLHQLEGGNRFFHILAAGSVTGVEVLKTRLAGGVSKEKYLHYKENQQ